MQTIRLNKSLNYEFKRGDVVRDQDGTFLICGMGNGGDGIGLVRLPQMVMLDVKYDSAKHMAKENPSLCKIDELTIQL